MKENNKSLFLYEYWLSQAIVNVAKNIIKTIEDNPNISVNFYVSFNTKDTLVKMPKYLQDAYPKTMTIVLQNKFYNLKTNALGFQVTLTFKGKPEDLFIPWQSLTAIVDPANNFNIALNTVKNPTTEKNSTNNDTSLDESLNESVKIINFPTKEK